MVPARLPAKPACHSLGRVRDGRGTEPGAAARLRRSCQCCRAVASRANGLAGAVRPRRPATRADRAGARGQGAAGNLAVQLAREAGARIAGTGRGRDRAATPAGGAQQFADLDSERFEEVAGQVDVVLDTIGGEVLDRSAAVVRPAGMLVSVALPPKIRPVDGRAMYFVVEPNGGELAELARRVQ
jgi:threonine dehydrogenase-like Zn-dependent dehydrogenase